MMYKNKSTGKYYNGGSMTRFINGVLWSGVPTEEQLAEWGYVEDAPKTIDDAIAEMPIEQQYKDLVANKIRARYSIDDEFALLRQRDSKTNEFTLYDTYCEQCKADTREELGIEEGGE